MNVKGYLYVPWGGQLRFTLVDQEFSVSDPKFDYYWHVEGCGVSRPVTCGELVDPINENKLNDYRKFILSAWANIVHPNGGVRRALGPLVFLGNTAHNVRVEFVQVYT